MQREKEGRKEMADLDRGELPLGLKSSIGKIGEVLFFMVHQGALKILEWGGFHECHRAPAGRVAVHRLYGGAFAQITIIKEV